MGNMGKAFRLQSAMEYLMTYGWAILIIAVVLGALFSLGIFNPAFLAPKVQPGSCQVERPDGPGTSAYVSIQGNCNNELPEYVAQFNGQSSFINISHAPNLALTGNLAIGWWFSSSLSSGTAYDREMVSSRCQVDTTFDMQLATTGLHGDIGTGTGSWLSTNVNYVFTPSQNTWYFVEVVIANTGWSIFLNGKNVSSGTYTGGTPSFLSSNDNLYLGVPNTVCGAFPFDGQIANMQLYNTSLSPSAIKYLYLEGIGGEPTSLTHLVGWWPLNGNANDYSGNENSGVNSNVIYTNGWTSGYTAP